MSSRIIYSCIPIAAAALLAACGDSTSSSGGTAEFRALHVTSTLGPVDIYVGGAKVVSGLAYGQTSAATSIPGGTQQFIVRSGSQVLAQVQYTLTGSHVNSMVISDSAAQFSDFVEPDTGQASPGLGNIRLVNVVGTNTSPPTQLDVLIKPEDPDSLVTSHLDATVAAYWSLMYFHAGQFNIKYVPTGQSTVLTEVNFSVAPGEKKAVVLSRADDGTYHAEVTVEP